MDIKKIKIETAEKQVKKIVPAIKIISDVLVKPPDNSQVMIIQ